MAILFRLVDIFPAFYVFPGHSLLFGLERHLKFQKLAAVEVAQAVVYNGVTIGCSLRRLGAAQLRFGLLSRSVAGAAIINCDEPLAHRLALGYP